MASSIPSLGRPGSSGTPDDWVDALLSYKQPDQLGIVFATRRSPGICTDFVADPDADGTGAEPTDNLDLFQAQLVSELETPLQWGWLDLCQDPLDLFPATGVMDTICELNCQDP